VKLGGHVAVFPHTLPHQNIAGRMLFMYYCLYHNHNASINYMCSRDVQVIYINFCFQLHYL